MRKESRCFTKQSFSTIRLLQFIIGMMIFYIITNINAYSLGGNWDTFFTPQGLAPKLSAIERTTSANLTGIRLRGSNMLAVNAIKDTSFTINVTHIQIGSSTDTASWELRTQDNTLLDSGTLLFNQADTISYQHDETEVLYLYITSGSNCYSLSSSDANVSIFAGTISKFFQGNTKEMWVTVPDKVKSFTLTLYSGGTNENVKVKVYNPSGTLVTQGETTLQDSIVDIPVTVGTNDDDVWKIEINTPSQGILDDFALKVSSDIPPVLSLNVNDEFSYNPFGSKEKVSIFINIVMSVANAYKHEAWMVDVAKNAGFNTYIAPRIQSTLTIEDIADWCDARDMKTFQWQRGTSAVSLTDSTYDGKRYFPGTGEEAILSPNSDELWTYLTGIASTCATSSLTHPVIKGLFFDFENYNYPDNAGYHQAYLLSYDDVIIGKYETARNITVSATPPLRKQWLIDNNYHDDFETFQLDHWRERVSQLREDIDAINPQFQFYVYPFGNFDTNNRPPFLYGENAPISKLSTAQSPIALAHYQSYFAPYSIIHDADLQMPYIRNMINDSISYAEEFGTPYMMSAGFDPICLDFYEFLARAPIAGAELGEGYWVFYEGLDYPSEEHTDCMDWFTWSNAKIAAEDYTAADALYTTTPSWESFWDQKIIPYLSCPFSSQNNTYSGYNMRATALMALSCESGTPVTIKLNFSQMKSYTDPLAWELRTLDDTTILDSGTLVVGQSNQTISFTPQFTGTFVLGVGSGLNVFNIAEANVPFAFYAGKKLSFCGNTNPLYINVPAGVTNFSVTAESKYTRQVKVSVYSPGGQLVAEDETTSANPIKVIDVSVGSYGSGAWKIVTGPAAVGYYEDFMLTISPEIPRFISLSSSILFLSEYNKLVFSTEVDEGTGNSVADDSIFENDGNIIGASWTTDAINGNALSFDGTNDYVDFGNSDTLDLSNSRSLSAWIKPDVFSNGYNTIVSKNLWGYSLFLYYGKLAGFVAGDPISDQSYSASSEILTIGEWQHVAMTFDDNDKKIRLYVNGAEVSSYSSQIMMTGSPGSTAVFDLCVGSNRGVADYFDGKIDEVKIYGLTRSEQDIFNEYNKNAFSTNIDEGTGTSVTDGSIYENDGTINGASWTTDGINGNALSFDGTDDYVGFGNSDELDLSSSRSLSAWIKPDALSSAYSTIVSKNLWGYSLFAYNGKLAGFVAGTPISNQSYSASTESLTVGEWQHVAMTFDDNDKQIRLYINGSEVSSYSSQKTMTGSPGSTSAYNLCIGSDRGVASYFDGIIDEVKVYSKKRSAQQIFNEYNKLVFSINLNEGTGTSAADDSMYENEGTINGATWATSGIDGNALVFDGTDDYVDFGNSAELDLSSSRSMTAWVKPDTITGYDIIVSKNLWGYSLYLVNGKLAGFVAGDPISDQSCSSSTAVLTTGEWCHVAMTFDDNDKQVRLYINGSEVSSYSSQVTMTGSPGSTAEFNLCVGSNRGVADYFDGVIDEVKVYSKALSSSQINDIYQEF
jgi:hypothetical protein